MVHRKNFHGTEDDQDILTWNTEKKDPEEAKDSTRTLTYQYQLCWTNAASLQLDIHPCVEMLTVWKISYRMDVSHAKVLLP